MQYSTPDYSRQSGKQSYQSENLKSNHHKKIDKEKPLLVDKFVVRFPRELREQIHQVANSGKRSINKEILARLEHSLRHFPSVPSFSSGEVLRSQQWDNEDVMNFNSPEAEIIVSYKLREKLNSLSFPRKRALLEFLESINE